MTISIKNELHPLYETIMLVYLHWHHDRLEQDAAAYLDGLEINSKEFYRNYMTVPKLYEAAFEENYRSHPEEGFLFEEYDDELILFLLTVLLDEKVGDERYEGAEAVSRKSDDELLRIMVELLLKDSDRDLKSPVPHSTEEYVRFIEELPLRDPIKWKLLKVFQKPKHWLGVFLDVYRQNRPAFDKAVKKYKKELDTLISQCPEIDNPHFEKIVSDFALADAAYPSVAFPLIEWIGNSYSFYGVLNPKVLLYQDQQERNKEALLTGLKLISDKSKFEILCTLKERPKYNLEIAEELGLTPATMSYHMNMLLSDGFVTIEKSGGKVYYHLSPGKLEELLSLFRQELM